VKRLIALVCIALSTVPALAYARQTQHSAAPRTTGGSEYYINVDGHSVHRPVKSQSQPQGATARCRDGSWSFSENRRGTCSHHGGVASWLR